MEFELRVLSLFGLACTMAASASVAGTAPALAASSQGIFADGTYTGQSADAAAAAAPESRWDLSAPVARHYPAVRPPPLYVRLTRTLSP